MSRWPRRGALLLLLWLPVLATKARAQDDSQGSMSQAEIESLRDTAMEPVARVRAFQRMLDDRAKDIQVLLKQGRRPSTAEDLHDDMDQMNSIADELNDNLDEYSRDHRDVRKALPKLVEAVERWSTVLRSAGNDDGYSVVRRIALDTLKDTQSLAQQMQTDQQAYFKAHPEALKQEKQRAENPHTPS